MTSWHHNETAGQQELRVVSQTYRSCQAKLTSCHSAGQINGLIHDVVPLAIGMADEVEDGGAISYSAQFCASLTDGQSINSAHPIAQSGRRDAQNASEADAVCRRRAK